MEKKPTDPTERPEPTVFAKVEKITGQTFPPEQQTPAMRKVLESLNAHYEALISKDFLTGIANLQGFKERLEQERKQLARNKEARNGQETASSPVTLVALDLDGFKAVNDEENAGHLGGDAALKHVATFFKTHLRPEDFIARPGGDEFLGIIKASKTDTGKLMSRLREQLVQEGFTYNGKQHYISYSYGMHELGAANAEDMTAAIAAADKAMYDDKKTKETRKARYDTPQTQPQHNGHTHRSRARRRPSSTESEHGL